jgi:type II secretory ATPase GspE/PulE/Tfp pilus assembly ATPase PilB-like protein
MTTAERDQIEKTTAEWAKLVEADYADTRQITDVDSLHGILGQTEMYDFGVVPLVRHGDIVELGFTDKTDRGKLPNLIKEGLTFNFHAISVTGFSHIFNLLGLAEYKPELYGGKFDKFADKLSNIEPRQIFYLIAQLAYEMKASDIHIEPGAGDPMVRFRLDGILHPVTVIPRERYEVSLSDLQTRSGIKWGSGSPQTGRISENLVTPTGDLVEVNMRIETIPAFHGEEVVIRLFNFDQTYLNIDQLNFRPDQLDVVKDTITHPTGMVLCTGPTGSGKTSTLYAIINHLNNPETKIVTLEDPVEYDLPGISQIPVKTDETESFTEKFRAVMREDPNVIMIGEIRDVDTAKTALQAALTGHLVLSTFHAASAAAAITRMVDMIGTSPLLASSLRLIIAQRLARRICPHCKESYKPSEEIAAQIKHALHTLPANLRPNLEKMKLFKGKGCEYCNGYGYLGRISIHEQLHITPKLEALLSDQVHKVTTQAISEIAAEEGMVTLLQDGLIKTLEGLTSAEEVFRVAAG